LAAWFSELEDEPTSESSLKEEYEKDRDRILLTLAEDEQGEPLGFYWAKRHKVEPDRLDFYLFVTPEQRGQGIGRQLYEALVQAAEAAQTKKLRVSAWDTSPEYRLFAGAVSPKSGIILRWRSIWTPSMTVPTTRSLPV
jgi:GNAT superfamily N-acetyltransferase